MRVLVDMNLSPSWVEALVEEGFDAVHWSEVGDPRASDRDLLLWAKSSDYVVFTNDLDFGSILAATGANGPSVVQVRAHNVTPTHLASTVVAVLTEFRAEIETGALLSVDESRGRVRLLPI